MRVVNSGLLVLFLLGGWCGGAAALELTGATVFLCDESGTVDASARWNSGPIDAAWDLFFYEGQPFDPAKGSADAIRWLNAGSDHSLKVPLRPGISTFTFHFECDAPMPRLGMNLFLEGRNEKPAISVFSKVASGGPPWPELKANAAPVTMGLPISEVAGAGTLSSSGGEGGLWFREDSGSRLKVTLKEHRILTPAAAGGRDLVGPHAVGPSGRADHVGTFTLEVESFVPRPPDLLLWLQAKAGLTMGEPDRSAEWKARFTPGEISPPFSFVYGGRSSREFLDGWTFGRSERKIDECRTACTLEFKDPGTGLEVRWEGVEYRDFKTIEWTLFFKAAGTAETPVLSDIRGLDVKLSRRPAEEFLLHHWKGTFVRRDDYEPLKTVLKPASSLRFAPPGGRPCGHVFPYYNLETSGEGMIVVVSWAGQWAARFERDGDRGLQVVAGQETTRFKLRPGEEVRSPLIVIQPWAGGDWIDAQNAWRRWMIRYSIPRPGGKLPPVPQLAACSSHQYAEMINANEENQKMFVDRYLEEGLKLDYWWMDAGWYVNTWGWPHTGTWEVDRKRFPNGLRAVSDHARAKGVKTIVWFEPERVAADTWLTRNHPEWIIGGAGGGLLDIGIPEARKWLADHIDGIITKEGIDLYRQDYNIDPLGHWRQKDSPDRQGITENFYVQGYLAYWDELLRRHPDMLIDSCASGGHRNDLETLRRSVPLLRSDYIFEPVGQQGHTYGLASWVPFFGTAVSPPGTYDPYTYRSHMCPHNTGCFDLRDKKLDYKLIRRLDAEWRRIAPFYFGDYYPLTPYSVEEDAWLAWQFHDPRKGEGVVQAFRRAGSIFFGARFPLRGLEPEAKYEVTDLDVRGTAVKTGTELAGTGVRVEIPERPGAAVLVYRKIKQSKS